MSPDEKKRLMFDKIYSVNLQEKHYYLKFYENYLLARNISGNELAYIEELLNAAKHLEGNEEKHLNELGICYYLIGGPASHNQDDKEQAVISLSKSIDYFKRSKNDAWVAFALDNLSRVYEEEDNDIEEFLNASTEALEIVKTHPSDYMINFKWVNLYPRRIKLLAFTKDIEAIKDINKQAEKLYRDGKLLKRRYDKFVIHSLEAYAIAGMNEEILRQDKRLSLIDRENNCEESFWLNSIFTGLCIYLEKIGDKRERDVNIKMLNNFWCSGPTSNRQKYLTTLERLIEIDSLRNDQASLINWYRKKIEFMELQKVERIASKKLASYWQDKNAKLIEKEIVRQQEKINYIRKIFYGSLIFSLLLGILSFIIFGISKKLRMSKKKLETSYKEIEIITNTVPIGLCKVDKNFDIIWSNKPIRNFYNIKDDVDEALNLKKIIHPSTFESMSALFKPNQKEELVVFEGALNSDLTPSSHFDKGMHWIKFIYIPIVYDDGNIEQYIILHDDHTHEKNQELKLKEKNEDLEAEYKTNLALLSNNVNSASMAIKFLEESKEITYHLRSKLIKTLDQSMNRNVINEIDHKFLQLNKEYFKKLGTMFPNLTNNNLKLCSYLKMNLTTKEIASLLFTSPESVKVARSRLRKRLGLKDQSTTLTSFLNGI